MRIERDTALTRSLGLTEIRWAVTPWERMRGMLGRAPFPAGVAMGFARCSSVHMLGMRHALDIVFLDRDNRVVRTVRNVRPWCPCVWGGWHARTTLELSASSSSSSSL